MSILEILWIIVKYGFIVSAISTAVAILFLLFHPLRFNLKLRSTIKGQRAELWFVYLFRLFKIGIVATPHTQDIVVKVAFWKKRLDRQQREKPEKPDSPAANDLTGEKPATFDSVSKATEQDKATPPTEHAESSTADSLPQTARDTIQKADLQKPGISEDMDPGKMDDVAATVEHDEPHDSSLPSQDEPEEMPSQPMSTTPVQNEEDIEPEHKTGKPTSGENRQSSSGEKADPVGHTAQSESFRARLRKIKRNMAKKFQQGKYYLRIVMIKWRKLAPVAKKFYTRSRKCFKIDDPNLVVYYALHEPYITGMFQGTLAVASGAAQRFGFRFVPIPMFGQPTIYARSAATAVIMPWRLALAVLGLIFEKELWLELWHLTKLLWAKWRNK